MGTDEGVIPSLMTIACQAPTKPRMMSGKILQQFPNLSSFMDWWGRGGNDSARASSKHTRMQLHLHDWYVSIPATCANGVCMHAFTRCLHKCGYVSACYFCVLVLNSLWPVMGCGLGVGDPFYIILNKYNPEKKSCWKAGMR